MHCSRMYAKREDGVGESSSGECTEDYKLVHLYNLSSGVMVNGKGLGAGSNLRALGLGAGS